ncbi:MAG: T9SS type A sorting domain-containing protein [Chitinophagales bacterium]|nr:T9SS type A sorting domain-containing protein [Chitinophagales bacterium]
MLIENLLKKCIAFIFSIVIVGAYAEDNYVDIVPELLYVTPNAQLSQENAVALNSTILSLYMAIAAQKYNELLNDSILNTLPLEDRYRRTFVLHPNNKKDTLYQIDVRIYSPSNVGYRYNRMIIARPYDSKNRPCILLTHGNNGNLNTWINYYMTGAADFLQRGYAVAFYENYNNSFFTNNSNTDPVYKDWVHHNIADSTLIVSNDTAIHRGHYLLYQYAYAAQTYLSNYSSVYNIDEDILFTGGHSAGALSSLQLAFADPNENFRHPIFEFSGQFDNRLFPNISKFRVPIKGVLSSAGGLQDNDVAGSYFGEYFDDSDKDIVAVMIHGKKDTLARVDYGPGLWGTFVDYVKLDGPLRLYEKMNQVGIKNFSFINCIGEHGVFNYPITLADYSSSFKNLSPLSYQLDSLSDSLFFIDTALYQIRLFHQQSHPIMSNVAQVFSRLYHHTPITAPSAIYTWLPKEYIVPIDLSTPLDWSPLPQYCDIDNAILGEFSLDERVDVGNFEHLLNKVLLYPNPCNDYINIDGLLTDVSVLIYNSLGVLQSTSILYSGEKITIPTNNLENGMYFMMIKDVENNVSKFKQFIVHR